jgi:hypothetical protein
MVGEGKAAGAAAFSVLAAVNAAFYHVEEDLTVDDGLDEEDQDLSTIEDSGLAPGLQDNIIDGFNDVKDLFEGVATLGKEDVDYLPDGSLPGFDPAGPMLCEDAAAAGVLFESFCEQPGQSDQPGGVVSGGARFFPGGGSVPRTGGIIVPANDLPRFQSTLRFINNTTPHEVSHSLQIRGISEDIALTISPVAGDYLAETFEAQSLTLDQIQMDLVLTSTTDGPSGASNPWVNPSGEISRGLQSGEMQPEDWIEVWSTLFSGL